MAQNDRESKMTETTQQTVQDMVKIVASAIDKAVSTYGPQAVDLAMMVYQVEAIKQLVNSAMYVSISLLILWIWLVPVRKIVFAKCQDYEYAVAGMAIYGMPAATAFIFMFFGNIQDLIYIPYWMAAFGNPEILMATKALTAAGAL